jgi:hypothetical protein
MFPSSARVAVENAAPHASEVVAPKRRKPSISGTAVQVPLHAAVTQVQVQRAPSTCLSQRDHTPHRGHILFKFLHSQIPPLISLLVLLRKWLSNQGHSGTINSLLAYILEPDLSCTLHCFHVWCSALLASELPMQALPPLLLRHLHSPRPYLTQLHSNGLWGCPMGFLRTFWRFRAAWHKIYVGLSLKVLL